LKARLTNYHCFDNTCFYHLLSLFWLISCLVPSISFSQAPNLKFKQISNEQGLSNSFISSTYQDYRGFMWFGTQNGLNRYDGDSIKVYRNDANDTSSLSNNVIQSIYEDHLHNLWVGTQNGLNRFDLYKDIFVVYKNIPRNKKSIGGNSVSNIFEDKKNNLWISTLGGGLNLLNRANNTFEHFRHNAADKNSICSDTVYCIFEDAGHSLWIGTDLGLELFNPSNKTFTLITNPFGKPANIINYIQQDHDGNLWLGTSYDGAVVYN